jgi:excisionase family DNA binding protein
MADNDGHRVTYEEAAQRLGVSVRTVQRRVRVGQLATVSDNGRQFVVLESRGADSAPLDEVKRANSAPYTVESASANSAPADARIAALEARVAELESDRDMWRTMSAKLSDTITEQNRMIAAQMMERGRMIAAETPREAPQAQPVTDTMPRTRRSLRALYMALRGSQRV